jgi:hypothetical protein
LAATALLSMRAASRPTPPDACRAAREYLATLDDAAFGAASDSIPKFVSPSDPAAQWTGALKGHATKFDSFPVD